MYLERHGANPFSGTQIMRNDILIQGSVWEALPEIRHNLAISVRLSVCLSVSNLFP